MFLQRITVISERSCDTEDWSNDAEKPALHYRNKLKYIKMELILNSFEQINAALSKKDVFQNIKKILPILYVSTSTCLLLSSPLACVSLHPKLLLSRCALPVSNRLSLFALSFVGGNRQRIVQR